MFIIMMEITKRWKGQEWDEYVFNNLPINYIAFQRRDKSCWTVKIHVIITIV